MNFFTKFVYVEFSVSCLLELEDDVFKTKNLHKKTFFLKSMFYSQHFKNFNYNIFLIQNSINFGRWDHTQEVYKSVKFCTKGAKIFNWKTNFDKQGC